jgi:DNA-binding MarR family transcriptional regulator
MQCFKIQIKRERDNKKIFISLSPRSQRKIENFPQENQTSILKEQIFSIYTKKQECKQKGMLEMERKMKNGGVTYQNQVIVERDCNLMKEKY